MCRSLAAGHFAVQQLVAERTNAKTKWLARSSTLTMRHRPLAQMNRGLLCSKTNSFRMDGSCACSIALPNDSHAGEHTPVPTRTHNATFLNNNFHCCCCVHFSVCVAAFRLFCRFVGFFFFFSSFIMDFSYYVMLIRPLFPCPSLPGARTMQQNLRIIGPLSKHILSHYINILAFVRRMCVHKARFRGGGGGGDGTCGARMIWGRKNQERRCITMAHTLLW